jgi:4-amino-4-deoxy-L-arabinose transferase-like glycosyltransferase/membrane-associated phospholipid phosphatase
MVMPSNTTPKTQTSFAGKGPLLSGLRRYGLYGLAVAFGLLALAIWPFDQTVSDALRLSVNTQGGLFLWRLAQPVKLFGKGEILLLIGFILAICHRKQVAVVACLALLIAGLIVTPMKFAFERQRPNARDARSFPSGDAASITAFMVPIAMAFPVATPIAVGGIAAIGVARVAVGFHFPSDILAGIAIGLFSSAVILSRRISLKPKVRRLLRRNWLLAALGLMVLVRLLMPGENEMKAFFSIFGPAAALVAVFPFIRAWARKQKQVEASRSVKREQTLALVLVIIVFVGLLFATTRSTLWGQDETRFSEATLEMVHSGNYLVPTFNGELRPDKPILIYWLMSLPVRIFGPTELACRFFAPLAASIVCLLTYRLSFGFFGPGTGLLALVILATTPLLFIQGIAATTDAVLLALIVAAFFVFEAALRKGPKTANALGLGLLLGAALLTKGPVGLVIPILSIVAILTFGRRLSGSWIKYLLISVLLATGIFLAWGIPANEATGGEFLRRGIGYHLVDRMSKPLETHGGNFFLFLPYYIPVVIIAFFPWILYLPAALSAVSGGRLGGKHARLFLLSWMIPTFLLMSFVSTKLPHYVLPIWPALSLAVAATIKAAEQKKLPSHDLVWLSRGRWLFGVTGLFGATLLMVGPWFVPLFGIKLPGFEPAGPSLIWYIAGLGCVLLTMTLLTLKEYAAGRYRSTVGILTAGVVAIIMIISILGVPMLERFKVAKPLAEVIRNKTSANVPAVVYDYKEASLIFYIGRQRLKSLDTDEEVVAWAKQSQPGVLVISQKALARIEAKAALLGLERIGAASGFNYSKGRWMDVVALGRNLH